MPPPRRPAAAHLSGLGLCRKCGRLRWRKARGLCYPCARATPAGPPSKFGRRADLPEARLAPPPGPTDHPPGTPGKVAVMAARAAAGFLLYHPEDAT